LTKICRLILILAQIEKNKDSVHEDLRAFTYLVTIIETERALCEVRPKPENI